MTSTAPYSPIILKPLQLYFILAVAVAWHLYLLYRLGRAVSHVVRIRRLKRRAKAMRESGDYTIEDLVELEADWQRLRDEVMS